MAEKQYLINESTLTGIADEYRSLLGTTDKLTPEHMKSRAKDVYDKGYEKGYKEGGGSTDGGVGDECTGVHINIVDELPENGVEGAYYGVRGFSDVVLVSNGEAYKMASLMKEEGQSVCLKHIKSEGEDMTVPDMSTYYFFYITIPMTDYTTPDIFLGLPTGIMPCSEEFECEFKGEITDISEVTEDGYYAYIGENGLYRCENGQYRQFVESGCLGFSSNDDGTCEVSGVGTYYAEDIIIPSTSPSGDTVTKIGWSAFRRSFINSITIPSSVTTIGSYAFSDSTLKEIVIPDSIETIDTNAFDHCVALTSITLPDKHIEYSSYGAPTYAFANCNSLEIVTIGNGEWLLPGYMFKNCVSLKEINLPASLTHIYGWALVGCVSLTTINFGGTMEEWMGVDKIGTWKDGVPATKVICSDGEVTISGGSSGSTTVTTEELVVDPLDGAKEITPPAGVYFSKVTVKELPSDYVQVSGSETVTENNKTVDVTNLASLTVSIPEFDWKVDIT